MVLITGAIIFTLSPVSAADLSVDLAGSIRALTIRVVALETKVAELFEKISNIQLIPGPQGEPGLPAQQGAGNIAFISSGTAGGNYLLKADGTVWVWGAVPGTPYLRIDGTNYSGVPNIPVPVSDIISWQYDNLLDKSGNYWSAYGNTNHIWNNFGPLP